MPAIGPAARALVSDARLSKADVAALEDQVQAGQTTLAEVQALAARYVDALDEGAGTDLAKLISALGGSMGTETPIANLGHEPGLLHGTVVLPTAGRNHPAVRTVQRGLMALANRTGDASFTLPAWGADGDYGSETTQAVRAFQEAKGLTVTGKVDIYTAQALDAALRSTNLPPIFAPGSDPAPSAPGSKSVADAARDLVEHHAQHYGVDDPWWNIDHNHALPADVRLGGLKGSWKCNLFACNVMVAAGFEPPYYGNRGQGEYPNANQLYKWTDVHAAQFGNAGHERFELKGEIMDLDQLDPAERRARLIELLQSVEPGDMIIVDHMGSGVADGGHCRVCLENNFGPDGAGTLACAQASYDSALVRDETLSKFTGEESIWILRPNTPRSGGPVDVI